MFQKELFPTDDLAEQNLFPEKYTMCAKDVGHAVHAGPDNCPVNNCPAVLKTNNGEAIIIGYFLNEAEVAEIEGTGKVKIYVDKGEVAIRVKAELLTKAAPYLQA